ncbi:MAG: LysR family transcriptional regulator [Pseudonocardiaceae bacterium]
MLYSEGMDVLEVRDLRYFLAVAEELNFSRAAERLGMAQPPLSRAIAQLERRLEVQLFERSTRQVKLTTAGLTLCEEARSVLDAISAAARRTRRAALTSPTLIVTAKPGIATGLLQQIVRSYTALPGTPQVEIAVSGYREQANMLRDGRADLALVNSPYDARGLDTEPLTSEPRVAALPAGHELASRAALSCHDLRRHPMAQWPGLSPAERLYWSGRDHEFPANGSIEPPIDVPLPGPVVNDSTQLLEVVALGQAVALVPLSMAEQNPRADIVYRPVYDASPYLIDVAWPNGSRAHSIALFVQTAVNISAEQQRANRAS